MDHVDQTIVASIRDKMIKDGIQTLYDEELISLIIKQGDETKDVLTLSKNLLKRYATLQELITAPILQLIRENRGLNELKAASLKASLELGKRAYKKTPSSVIVSEPEDIVDLLKPDMKFLSQECFKAVLLNTKNMVICIEDISIGIINASLVHAREVFRAAIAKNAYSIILAHNHPSGDPQPSQNDKQVTVNLKKAGEIIGIKVMDHIIIGADNYYSFNAESDF